MRVRIAVLAIIASTEMGCAIAIHDRSPEMEAINSALASTEGVTGDKINNALQ